MGTESTLAAGRVGMDFVNRLIAEDRGNHPTNLVFEAGIEDHLRLRFEGQEPRYALLNNWPESEPYLAGKQHGGVLWLRGIEKLWEAWQRYRVGLHTDLRVAFIDDEFFAQDPPLFCRYDLIADSWTPMGLRLRCFEPDWKTGEQRCSTRAIYHAHTSEERLAACKDALLKGDPWLESWPRYLRALQDPIANLEIHALVAERAFRTEKYLSERGIV
jgi:hypothetical protein